MVTLEINFRSGYCSISINFSTTHSLPRPVLPTPCRWTADIQMFACLDFCERPNTAVFSSCPIGLADLSTPAPLTNATNIMELPMVIFCQVHRPRVPGDGRPHPLIRRVQPRGGLPRAAHGPSGALCSAETVFPRR